MIETMYDVILCECIMWNNVICGIV